MLTPFVLPDNGVPIKVGDRSFVYKNVFHPIEWFAGEPYRTRVETLVIGNAGTSIFLRLDEENHKYRIPGGSVDDDSSFEKQAENETNEEALISVKDLVFSGITYQEKMDKNFLKKGHDFPIAYVGAFNYVYTAIYTGKVDKSTIEEKDLDDDMANNGKFYPINKVASILHRHHLEALCNSNKVNPVMKIALQNNLSQRLADNRNSPIFESDDNFVVKADLNRIYHGSTYDIDVFHPMSIDFGNGLEKPGWSTFCFRNKTWTMRFALMRLIQNELSGKGCWQCGWDLTEKKPYLYRGIIDEVKRRLYNKKFYVYCINAENLELGIGNDARFPEVTFRQDNVVPESRDIFYVDDNLIDDNIRIIDTEPSKYEKYQIDNIKNLDRGWFSCMLNRNFVQDSVISKLIIATGKGDLKPGDDIEEYMKAHNMELKDVSFIERLAETSEELKIATEVFDLSGDYEETLLLGENKVLFTSNRLEKGDYLVENIDKEVYFLPKTKSLPPNAKIQYRRYMYHIDNKGDTFLMAISDFTTFESSDSIYGCARIFVRPMYRMKRLGSILLDDMVEYMKNITPMRVAVEVHNDIISKERIKSWIERYSFTEVGNPSDHSVGFISDTKNIMEKKIEKNLLRYINEGVLDVYRDIMVGKYVYHASCGLYDMLEPTGLDLGNVIEQPGWSLYTWKSIEDAFGWGIYQCIKKINNIYNVMSDCICLYSHVPVILDVDVDRIIYAINKCDDKFKRYYIYHILINNDMVVGLGHSSNTKNCVTIRNPHIKYSKVDTHYITKNDIYKYCKIVTKNEFEKIKTGGFNHRHSWILMNNDLMFRFIIDRNALKTVKNAISSGELIPGDSIEEFMNNHNLKFDKISFIERLVVGLDSSVDGIRKRHNMFISENNCCELTIIDMSNMNSDSIPYTESLEDNSLLEPIYIVLAYTGTAFGKVITEFQHCKFSHAGISLDSKLDKIFTFNMRTETKQVEKHGKITDKKQIKGGAHIESVDDCSDNADICVMCVFVDPSVKKVIEDNINKYFTRIEETRYSISNVFNIVINRAIETGESMKMICSQFVDNILKLASIDITKKSSNLVSPNDFAQASRLNPKIFVLFDDKKEKYNSIDVDKKVRYIKNTNEYSDLIINESIGREVFVNSDFILEHAITQFDDKFKQRGYLKLSDFKKLKADKLTIAKYKESLRVLDYSDVDNDACIGFIWVDDNDEFVGDCAIEYGLLDKFNWITVIEVSEKYQGYGLGNQILDYAVKSLGGNTISVLEENVVACQMYEKYGFKISKRSRNDVKSKRSCMYFMYLPTILSKDCINYANGITIGYANESSLIESKHDERPMYFYHLVPKSSSISKGITTLQYQYDTGDIMSFRKNSDKYRERLCFGWGIYPGREPKSLSDYEILTGIKRFRDNDMKNGANRIYMFLYPPYKNLGIKMRNILDGKDIYRININDKNVKKYISDIDWGFVDSNSGCDRLTRDYYENTSPEQYFYNYTEDGGRLLFSYMNHISIVPKYGYIPKKFWEKIDTPDTLEDVIISTGVVESSVLFEAEGDENLPSLGRDDKTSDYTKDAQNSIDDSGDSEGSDEGTGTPEDVETELEDPNYDSEEETSDDSQNEETSDSGQDTESETDVESDLGDGSDYTQDVGGDSGEESSDSTETENNDSGTENENKSNNNTIKNYSVLRDFDALFRLANEMNKTLEPIIMEKPIQNKVLTQIRENLSAITAAITDFITLHFRPNDYAFNLYYYELFVGVLNKNLQMLEKNKAFSKEELKNKIKTNQNK